MPELQTANCLDPGVFGPPTAECMSHWENEEPRSDLVYLGLNDPSRAAEIAALPAGATVIDGSKKQGTIMGADGETELDLGKEADVQRFLRESGAYALRTKDDGSLESEDERDDRMAALEAVFLGDLKDGKRVANGMHKSSKDEMAELIQTLQKVENGELDMKRLIISGHHYPWEQGIHGTDGDGTGIRYDHLQKVLGQFGHARSGVEDLMFSACNTVNGVPAQNDRYLELFPGLESVWGYHGLAPAPGVDPSNSSPAHIRAWEEASRGDDPQAVLEESKRRFHARTTLY